MKNLVIGTILGIVIGVIATEVFYSYAADKTEKLSELIQYKFINSFLIKNGKPEVVKEQLKSWLIYLESYEPNKYSTLPTKESVYLEKTATYYLLATLEKDVNISNIKIDIFDIYLLPLLIIPVKPVLLFCTLFAIIFFKSLLSIRPFVL